MADNVWFATSNYDIPMPQGWQFWDSTLEPPAYKNGTKEEYFEQVTLKRNSGFNGFPFPIFAPPNSIKDDMAGNGWVSVSRSWAAAYFWRVKSWKIDSCEGISAYYDFGSERVPGAFGAEATFKNIDGAQSYILTYAKRERDLYKYSIGYEYNDINLEYPGSSCYLVWYSYGEGGGYKSTDWSESPYWSVSGVGAFMGYYRGPNQRMNLYLDLSDENKLWAKPSGFGLYCSGENIPHGSARAHDASGRWSSCLGEYVTLEFVAADSIHAGTTAPEWSFGKYYDDWVWHADLIIYSNTLGNVCYKIAGFDDVNWPVMLVATLGVTLDQGEGIGEEIPPPPTGPVSNVAISVPTGSFDLTYAPKEYWPYKNSAGDAVWDKDTGAQLCDPCS